MTVEISKREREIELWKEHDFITFPIKKGSKAADTRYDAANTKPNQTIKEDENWGVIGTKDGHNGTLDFDDKERDRKFAEHMKKEFKVIESPHGWHIPFVNMGNTVTKMELFNLKTSKDKVIEIQGYKHYVVGIGS